MENSQQLIDKYLAGIASREEIILVERFYLEQFIQSEFPDRVIAANQLKGVMWNQIRQRSGLTVGKRNRGLWLQWSAAAAAVILIVGAGLFWFWKSADRNTVGVNFAKINEIAPGGNKAVITLANGKKMNLSNSKTGVVINASNLTYNDGTGLPIPASSQFTINTPRGGQYQVVLPDGSKVWLNAASSLKFPSSFASLKERKVQLTGEGYFEVAKDKSHPFMVCTNTQTVEVLGTHFNINSYTDEASVKTTLLEGSVRLNQATILKPGQQASLTPAGRISVEEVNTEKSIAWKNGKFVFENENIENIMKKLARWYDVEVIYHENVGSRTFTGSISRNSDISKILEKITLTEAVHFKIEGRRVTVMP